MPLTNSYATVAQLRTHLADSGSTLTLEMLERALNAASRSVDAYCRRFFYRTGVMTRTYTVDDATSVYVDDIATRTGLVVSTGTDGTTYPTTLLSGTDFVLEPRNADALATGGVANPHAFWQITLFGGKRFTVDPYRSTLSVTADFGWSAVPAEVEQATLLKAAQLFRRKDAPFGVAGFGEFGVVRIGRQDPDVVDMLAPFVLPVVA